MTTERTVLVTGASGFIGMHCILQLLEQGYQVRGTIRSAAKGEHLRQVLQQHTAHTNKLTFAEADLTQDAGWAEAVAGCDFVLHVASPLPMSEPKDENDLIVPAVEGTLRVLRAAHAAGVQRVVQTSSMAAIVQGHDTHNKRFDESDWTNLQGKVAAYPKSKTMAERAAWDFVNQPDVTLELATINPSYVLGPVLDARQTSTSVEVIRKLLRRDFPGAPRLNFPVVDVRDVAAAHLAAMTNPDAVGKRFICSVDNFWVQEMAQILNNHFASQGYKVPTVGLPDFLVRLVALFDKTAALVVNDLGRQVELTNDQIKSVLNWQPRSAEEAVVALGKSLIELNAV